MGDMNIDLLNFAHHDKTNSFIDSIFSLGYLPFITKPTRIAHTSAKLLDHIYSNSINDQTINGRRTYREVARICEVSDT